MNTTIEIRNEYINLMSEIYRCMRVMGKKEIPSRQRKLAYSRLNHILLPQFTQLQKKIQTI